MQLFTILGYFDLSRSNISDDFWYVNLFNTGIYNALGLTKRGLVQNIHKVIVTLRNPMFISQSEFGYGADVDEFLTELGFNPQLDKFEKLILNEKELGSYFKQIIISYAFVHHNLDYVFNRLGIVPTVDVYMLIKSNNLVYLMFSINGATVL